MRQDGTGGAGNSARIVCMSEPAAKNASTALNENNKINLPSGRWKHDG
jgi:hypothetical protein